MIFGFQRVVRSFVIVGLGLLFTGATLAPGSAQMREQIKNKVVDDVANQMVSTIQTDSCPEFASMLKQQKSGSSNSGKASGMMKKDPAARQRFVNKVAGPLLNKMIDCDLIPNG